MVWTGLRYYRLPPPGAAWQSFTCEQHVDHLIAPRRLTDRDRALLERRREKWQRGLAGLPGWQPDPPLATGPAARALIERARRWAAEHGDDTTQT